MPRTLDIKTETVNGVEVVNLGGALDTENRDAFRSVMDPLCSAAGAARILVDCTHLLYVNSACFGLFNAYHAQCQAARSKLAFCGLSEKLLGIMRLLGLTHTLNLYATRAEALKALAATE